MRQLILTLAVLGFVGIGLYAFQVAGANPFGESIHGERQTFTIRRGGETIVVQGTLLYTREGRELVPLAREDTAGQSEFCEVDALVSVGDGAIRSVVRAAPNGANIRVGENVLGVTDLTTPLYVYRDNQGVLRGGCASFYQLDQIMIENALSEAQGR